MSDWRSIVGLPSPERARLFELADFGVVEFRARTMIELDYEPAALAKREAEIDEERRKADAGAVKSLGPAATIGSKPWLADVPMERTVIENFPMPRDLLPLLSGDIWDTGQGTFQHPHDDRQRGLFSGIEYRYSAPDVEVSYPGIDATLYILPTGLQGRPSKGRDAILAEFSRRIESGYQVGTKAGEARKLISWLAVKFPDCAIPTEKTVGASIAGLWREARQRTNNRPELAQNSDENGSKVG